MESQPLYLLANQKQTKEYQYGCITKKVQIHQHDKGLTLTAVFKGHKEHFDIDKYQTVEDFGGTLSFFYDKLKQKWGTP
jgi:hypothetical protein